MAEIEIPTAATISRLLRRPVPTVTTMDITGIAAAITGANPINDNTTTASNTWSAQKTQTEITNARPTYLHSQASPSTTWTINHNLGSTPAVTVTDSAGEECEGEVDHPTLNQTVITFSAAFSGTARLI